MMRAEADREGREVIDVIDEREDGEVVTARVAPSEDVDAEADAEEPGRLDALNPFS